MRCHITTLPHRLRRTALRSPCSYRVAAAGIDYRGRLIAITTNLRRLTHRHSDNSLRHTWSLDLHAEARLLLTTPRTLSTIVIARVNSTGDFLPIHPCNDCERLASKRGVKIVSVEEVV